MTDLKAEELYISVDNNEQKIDSVQFNPSAPLTVLLFFDVSGRRGKDLGRAGELKAFSDFLHRIWRLGDSAFARAFNQQILPGIGLSQDLEAIDRALHSIADVVPRGSTAAYDTICAILTDQAFVQSGRRLVFVISDFEDNASHCSEQAAIERAWKARIPVYPFVLREGSARRLTSLEKRARKSAVLLSNQTGGEVFALESASDLSRMLDQLSGRVRSFYVLTYSPSVTSSEKKPVSLGLRTARPGVTLLFPKGGYVPTD